MSLTWPWGPEKGEDHFLSLPKGQDVCVYVWGGSVSQGPGDSCQTGAKALMCCVLVALAEPLWLSRPGDPGQSL